MLEHLIWGSLSAILPQSRLALTPCEVLFSFGSLKPCSDGTSTITMEVVGKTSGCSSWMAMVQVVAGESALFAVLETGTWPMVNMAQL